MRILPEALVVSFVNYRGKPSRADEAVGEGEPAPSSACRLACFHHYDEIHLGTVPGSTDDVISLFSAPAPRDAIAARKVICYFVDGERSADFDLNSMGLACEVLLLRLNQRLKVPTLHAEAELVQRIKGLVGESLSWAVAHTFARNELLLIVSSDDSLRACERVGHSLRTVQLHKNSKAAAFEAVITWPCRRLDPGQTVYDVDEEALVGETLDHVAAVRVVGPCQKELGEKYACAVNLNRYVHEELLAEDGAVRKRRAVVGSDRDRQVAWPTGTKSVLAEVQRMRRFCSNTCCSNYLRWNLDAPETQPWVFDHEPPVADGELVPFPAVSLAIVKKHPGSKLIGEHLERISNEIMEALSNPLIAPEFQDLVAVPDLLQYVVDMYEWAWGGRAKGWLDGKREYEAWANCRGLARRLALFLQQAIDERIREDVRSESHHIESAGLGASGISRVATVGSTAIRKTLAAFAITDWGGLCVNGVFPAYRNDALLELYNSPVQATLQPHYHFGLGHEIGHAIWESIVLGKGTRRSGKSGTVEDGAIITSQQLGEQLGPSEIRELAEYFCDAVCLKFTFGMNIEAYLQDWIPYYHDWLETEIMHDFLASISGDSFCIENEASSCGGAASSLVSRRQLGLRTKARVYCERLLVAAAVAALERSDREESAVEVAAEAHKLVRGHAYAASRVLPDAQGVPAFQSTLDLYARAVEHLRARDTTASREGAVDGVAQGVPDDEEDAVVFMRELGDTARLVLSRFIDQLPTSPSEEDVIGSFEVGASAVTDGTVVEDPVQMPLAFLAGVPRDGGFNACVAASLSLTHWGEVG